MLRSVDPPIAAVHDQTIRGVRRIGKRIVLEFDGDLFLVLHLMIAGRLRWRAPGKKPGMGPKMLLASFDFAHGRLFFTEASSKKRASLQLVRGEEALRALDPGGVEPLDATVDEFHGALVRESHTLKRALTDPHLFSGIGNAYSDEILHAARLSPMKLTRSLTDDEVVRLYGATRATLERWVDRLRAETAGGFPEKVTPSTTRWRCTAASASRARCADRRCSGSSTPRTSATTARPARPAAACWPTDRCRDC